MMMPPRQMAREKRSCSMVRAGDMRGKPRDLSAREAICQLSLRREMAACGWLMSVVYVGLGSES